MKTHVDDSPGGARWGKPPGRRPPHRWGPQGGFGPVPRAAAATPRGRRRLGPGGGFAGGFGPGGGVPGGFGAEGPGHGGFGPGGFGPGGFGPGGFGPGGRRGGHGRRRGRGNVRAAVLALLAEQPRHGYSIMTELAERSGGLWRPSPGSVYPVLQQLQDEGLVTSSEVDGRRVFALTEDGARHVREHAEELREPWRMADPGPVQRVQALMRAAAGLAGAVEQVARTGDDAQAVRAVAVLEEARRSMYRILAEDTSYEGAEDGGEDGAEDGPGSAPPAG